MKGSKKLQKKLAAMDKKLLQAEKDFEYLDRFLKRFRKIEKNLAQLEGYYFTDWIDDVEAYYKDNPDAHCKCCNQDSIWNVSQDIYQKRVEILKAVANSM